MTTYEVKMGVPLPPKRSGQVKTPLRVVLESMPLGGMVEVENSKTIRATVETVKKTAGGKFSVRVLTNGNVGIWRTA